MKCMDLKIMLWSNDCFDIHEFFYELYNSARHIGRTLNLTQHTSDTYGLEESQPLTNCTSGVGIYTREYRNP